MEAHGQTTAAATIQRHQREQSTGRFSSTLVAPGRRHLSQRHSVQRPQSWKGPLPQTPGP
jgi:hypothetical protein